MEWTKDRVKELRLKMGWSHSDMARHLSVGVNIITDIENGVQKEIETLSSALTMYWQQSENLSDEVLLSALAEQVLENEKLSQLFRSELQDQYLDE